MKEFKEIKGEEWLPIHEGSSYYVSNMGRVKGPRGLIKPQPNSKTGLIQCMAYVNGKPKLLNVCQWVGRLFLEEKPFPEAVVRHKSNNLKDDRVTNLYWGKPGGTGYRKPPCYRYIIKQKTIHGLVIGQYVGWEQLKRLGFKRRQIIAASNGKYRHGQYIYKNFTWEVTKIKTSKQDEV